MRFRLLFLLLCGFAHAQVRNKLDAALNKLKSDSQFSHAIISMYVVDTKTNAVLYDMNAEVGQAPASCQKVITAVTSFDLLGKDYTYKTKLGFDGKIDSGILKGNIYIIGNGDPSLGSSHFTSTRDNVILTDFKNAVRAKGIRLLRGLVLGDDRQWSTQRIPDGWIWQDIGNYYGAGASALNWRENQYELILRSGRRVGEGVSISSTRPRFLPGIHLINELTSAEKGSGDNAYIYLAPDAEIGFVRGTIPIGEDSFVIAGSLPDPGKFLAATLYQSLLPGKVYPDNNVNYLKGKSKWGKADSIFYTHSSPTLDSLVYWFLKRSINLYGEAFIKTLGYEKNGKGTTESGVKVITDFWAARGVGSTSLKIIDGSGLSPGNRVTANALVTVMQYAVNRPWFSSFYLALPEINGLKMKDGYINGVRSYTGYIKGSQGEFTFSFIVNNFDGNPSTVRQKMWKVLDVLK